MVSSQWQVANSQWTVVRAADGQVEYYGWSSAKDGLVLSVDRVLLVKVASVQWSMVNVVSGQRSVVGSQCSRVNGQWSVVNGQWSVVNSQ